MIRSIESLAQAMKKNQFLLEVNMYMEQLMREANSDDLQLNTENMQKYISGPATLETMLRMLQDDLDKGYRTIYPKAMEERVYFQKDITK